MKYLMSPQWSSHCWGWSACETWWGTWASAPLCSAEYWLWPTPWLASTLDLSELTPPDWVHNAPLELEHCCWAPHSWHELRSYSELTWQLELPLHWRAEVLLPFWRWRWQLKLTTVATLEWYDSTQFETAVKQDDWDNDGLGDTKWKTMRIQVANRALNRIKVQRYLSLDCLVCLDCLDWLLLWACLLLWLMIAMIVTDTWLTFTNMTVNCLTFLNIAIESWYPRTMKWMTDMMNAMNVHHLLVAEAFWMTWFSLICIWTSEWLESWFSLPRREGGGVKVRWILPEADLNLWITKSCWPWNASKLIIQTWPWCWAQTWCNRAGLWSSTWLPLWLWRPRTRPIELTLNTWDNDESLKRLSLGRWLPNTDAWTNLVRMSEGLWWVPTFSSDMTPSLRMSWIHKCLSSMCFDLFEFSLLMSLSWVWFSHPLKESPIWVPWWSAWSPMNRLMPES